MQRVRRPPRWLIAMAVFGGGLSARARAEMFGRRSCLSPIGEVSELIVPTLWSTGILVRGEAMRGEERR